MRIAGLIREAIAGSGSKLEVKEEIAKKAQFLVKARLTQFQPILR